MTATVVPAKPQWLVLWAAFTAAPVVYYVVATTVAGTVTAPPGLPMFRMLLGALALLELAAGAFLMTRATRARSDVPAPVAFFGGETLAEPQAFQVAFIVAAALVEACAIMGFVLVFLGAPALEYLPFGAGTLAVMLGIALPTGLGYWSERERMGTSGMPPIQ